MKERPILFNGPMVRAILDGTKTQTRRVMKHQPAKGWAFESPPVFGRITSPHPKKGRFGVLIRRGVGTDFPETDLIPCPYGQPGDRLWVREAWRTVAEADAIPPRDMDEAFRLWFEVEAPHQPGAGKYRPPMFMPRWASRITLEITRVRVERLQDIREGDAIAEGCTSTVMVNEDGEDYTGHYATEEYQDLWESINGPGSWGQNPWMWVIEFKRVEGGAA